MTETSLSKQNAITESPGSDPAAQCKLADRTCVMRELLSARDQMVKELIAKFPGLTEEEITLMGG